MPDAQCTTVVTQCIEHLTSDHRTYPKFKVSGLIIFNSLCVYTWMLVHTRTHVHVFGMWTRSGWEIRREGEREARMAGGIDFAEWLLATSKDTVKIMGHDKYCIAGWKPFPSGSSCSGEQPWGKEQRQNKTFSRLWPIWPVQVVIISSRAPSLLTLSQKQLELST